MFIDMFDEKEEIVESVKPKIKSKSVPDIIRSYVKIKLTVPTNFGTEYILAKKYNKELTLLTQALDDLVEKKSIKNYRLKGNSIFVE